MSVVVAESELAQALDVTTKTVRLRAADEGWLVKKTSKQGGSEWFYFRDLLPVNVRQELVAHEAVTDQAGLPAVVHDTPVPKRSRQVGLAKYNLVHAFRLAKEGAGWGQKGQAASEFLLTYNAGLLMPQVFETVGEIQLKTLEALDKKLRQNRDNYLCLCDGRGG